jgi:hypothetical protein
MSFVEELRQRDEATGLDSRYVIWGPKAETLTENEKARIVLALDWENDRGWIPSTTGNHFANAWAVFKAKLYRAIDWVFGIENPYKEPLHDPIGRH